MLKCSGSFGASTLVRLQVVKCVRFGIINYEVASFVIQPCQCVFVESCLYVYVD